MTKFAATTHAGLKRSHNEDCYAADSDLGLWLVADGVGGHANGEVASAIVRDTIKSELADGCSLVDAIHNAHHAVLEQIRRQDSGSNMGSTVVALALRDDAYEVAWVGDSRAYLFDGELKQLTRDHSPIGEMLALGALTPDQAKNHPDRHMLSQSLGVSEAISLAPGHISGRLQPGQQIMLCSDGLTDELNDQAIAARLQGKPSPRSQVEALLRAALEAGGHDNITVVVVGAPGAAGAGLKHPGPNMETTQDITQSAAVDGTRQGSHDVKVWLMLAAMVLVAAFWLLVWV